jgi:hypothetical protein
MEELFDKKKYLSKQEIEELDKVEASKHFTKSYTNMQSSVQRVSKTKLAKNFWVSLWELISTKIFGVFKPKKEQETLQLNKSSKALDQVSNHFSKQEPNSKNEKEIFRETKKVLDKNEK